MPSRDPKKEPSLPTDVALRALGKQLAALDGLKGRRYDEAAIEETEWRHLTQCIIEDAFGVPSTSVDRFHHAKWAGSHTMGDTDPWQHQQNYDARLAELGALLRALIEGLQLRLPPQTIQFIYQPGDEYAFYRDLGDLIEAAQHDILVVDPYLDKSIFDLYADKVPKSVNLRILTNAAKVNPNFAPVARLYATGKSLEVRTTSNIHDRHVFIDDRAWVIGQSIKDAATTKPTYLVEFDEPDLSASRNAYNGIWSSAAPMTL